MQRLSLKDLDGWLLSGQPVVRFAGKDFEQSPEEYASWLKSLSAAINLPIAVLVLNEPPAVVAQAYLPTDERPKLVDPLLKVTKGSMAWLFCVGDHCRVRVPAPGTLCEVHR